MTKKCALSIIIVIYLCFCFSLDVFVYLLPVDGFVTVHLEVRQHTIDGRKFHFTIVVSNRSDFDVLVMDVAARRHDVRNAKISVMFI